MSFFDSHEDNCRPLDPCRNCRATFFLKEKLGDSSFGEFLSILGMERPRSQPAVEQIPLDTQLIALDQFDALSVRVRNGIKNENILTLRDLVSKTEAEMLRVPNLGRHSLNEIKRMLTACGHRLGVVPLE